MNEFTYLLTYLLIYLLFNDEGPKGH